MERKTPHTVTVDGVHVLSMSATLNEITALSCRVDRIEFLGKALAVLNFILVIAVCVMAWLFFK